jgi:crotonobetainyl-CoA:carnitine CoA-transferase CaiB-like acyl-CoA transferase
LDRVFENQQVIERQMIQEVNHPKAGKVKLLGTPVKLSDTPAAMERHPPLHGEHTEEVLMEIGYNKKEIESFFEGKYI